jgi:WD40 repeat protein
LPEGVIPYYDRHEQTLGWCTKGALHFTNKDGQLMTVELPVVSDCDGIVVSPQRHYALVWRGVARYLINLETGKFNKISFPNKGWESETLAARFSSDEKILITCIRGLVTVWQVNPPQPLVQSSPGINTGHNVEVIFAKDDSSFVTLNDARDQSKSDGASELRIWRVEDAFAGRVIDPPLIGSNRPDFTSFVLSPDDKLIASGDSFGSIRIWSVKTGDEISYFDIDALPLDMAFTPDGSGLLIVLGDGTVRLWGVP